MYGRRRDHRARCAARLHRVGGQRGLLSERHDCAARANAASVASLLPMVSANETLPAHRPIEQARRASPRPRRRSPRAAAHSRPRPARPRYAPASPSRRRRRRRGRRRSAPCRAPGSLAANETLWAAHIFGHRRGEPPSPSACDIGAGQHREHAVGGLPRRCRCADAGMSVRRQDHHAEHWCGSSMSSTSGLGR